MTMITCTLHMRLGARLPQGLGAPGLCAFTASIAVVIQKPSMHSDKAGWTPLAQRRQQLARTARSRMHAINICCAMLVMSIMQTLILQHSCIPHSALQSLILFAALAREMKVRLEAGSCSIHCCLLVPERTVLPVADA